MPLAVALVGALIVPARGSAQGLPAQRPTPQEAQEILQQQPELARQLRERLLRSGLSPNQIRARLRAEGYPEHMLDAYLSDGNGADAAPPSDSVYAALQLLGIQDSTSLDSLSGRAGMGRQSRPGMFADSAAVPDSLQVFGLSLFRSSTSVFDPVVAGPVDASYVLGPGDQLVLVLSGDVEMAQALEVTREGFVVIPRVGQVFVANLTLGQADRLIASRLRQAMGDVGDGPSVATEYHLTVARLRVNQIFVVGEVAAPGSYQVSGAGTALTALYAAGGPTETGSLRRIEVRRGGRTVASLDLYDYLLRGDASGDARLQTGDVVFVGRHGPRVRAAGEVLRPAIYELEPGETLADLIAAAGGFTAAAARQRVMVERILPPGQRAADGRDRVVLDAPASANGDGVRLEDGDVVHVFPIAPDVRDRITVTGRVWSPGPQGLTPGMRLSDALRQAGGLRPDALISDILVTRMLPDSSRQQLRASLRERNGAPDVDLPLAENDEIRVFGTGEFRRIDSVTVHGAVRAPGTVEFREGMTLRDLILQSGGLAEGASLEFVEIARQVTGGRNPRKTSDTIRVALDSTYFVASGASQTNGGAPAPNRRDAGRDLTLRPHDQVLVLHRPDWLPPRTVAVTGEVRYEGRYTLASRDERITDVLARAGGLTDQAYADGFVLVRTGGGKGRIAVDLPRILRDVAHRDNLVLQDGDSISIPQLVPVVEVVGAVYSPSSAPYVPGANVDYYVGAAGGPTRRAESSRVYVVQPNGKVEPVRRRRFLPDAKPTPKPGATIHVPARESDVQRDWGSIVASTAQVMGILVAIVALVRR